MDKPTLRFDLPEDILKIIKEYSMPVTRPDWRTLHKMPIRLYMGEYIHRLIKQEHMTDKFEFNVYTISKYYHLFRWNLSNPNYVKLNHTL